MRAGSIYARRMYIYIYLVLYLLVVRARAHSVRSSCCLQSSSYNSIRRAAALPALLIFVNCVECDVWWDDMIVSGQPQYTRSDTIRAGTIVHIVHGARVWGMNHL